MNVDCVDFRMCLRFIAHDIYNHIKDFKKVNACDNLKKMQFSIY